MVLGCQSIEKPFFFSFDLKVFGFGFARAEIDTLGSAHIQANSPPVPDASGHLMIAAPAEEEEEGFNRVT